MATVAEMIEFFKTLPQDAIVECAWSGLVATTMR